MGIARRYAQLAMIATAAVTFSLTVALAARADENQPRSVTKVAAVESRLDNPPGQLGLPVRSRSSDADLRVLLAQNGPPSQTDATVADDTILVALASNVPLSVDEDIAKQHGLELLERTELPDLDLRIVRFRAPGHRTVGSILADLHKDQRIRRAQRNAQYGAPDQRAAPDIDVSRLKDAARTAARSDNGTQTVGRRRSDRNRTAGSRIAQNSPPKSGAPRNGEPMRENTYQAQRAGKVGDVLSGGL